MSTLNKFVIYECDVCKRKTEVAINGQRPDPIRCNITYKCRGKLKRIGESSTKKFLFTPPIAGLQDYVQRGTSISTLSQLKTEKDISLFTGAGSGMLTIALPRRVEHPGSSHTFEVLDSSESVFVVDSDPDTVSLPDITANLILFKISPNLLQFRRYTYLVNGVIQVIRGPDDSPDANNLKFNATNSVRVFINGVELDPSQYDKSVNDLITFTPAIYESNNVVDVIVYNNLSSSTDLESVKLEFKVLNQTVVNDLSMLEVCSWGDSRAVTIDGVTKYLLHCTDLSQLSPDYSYGVSAYELTSATETRVIRSSEIMFLLGNSPYTTKDKELLAFISGKDLVNSSNVLSYGQNQDTGVTELTVKESVITQLSRSLIPTDMVKIESVSSSEVVSTNVQHQYILGPT